MPAGGSSNKIFGAESPPLLEGLLIGVGGRVPVASETSVRGGDFDLPGGRQASLPGTLIVGTAVVPADRSGSIKAGRRLKPWCMNSSLMNPAGMIIGPTILGSMSAGTEGNGLGVPASLGSIAGSVSGRSILSQGFGRSVVWSASSPNPKLSGEPSLMELILGFLPSTCPGVSASSH
jgi:hypothetical protein